MAKACWDDVDIVCPFFKHKENKDLVKKIEPFVIGCEGAFEGSLVILHYFQSGAKRNRHLNDFCKSKCWQGCPYAQMLNDELE